MICEIILIIGATILLALFIRRVIDDEKLKEQERMQKMLEDWPLIKRRINEHSEFSRYALELIAYFIPNLYGITWTGDNRHGKYFSTQFFEEVRFYPSDRTFGSQNVPDFYLKTEEEQEEYYLKILDRLCDYIYATYNKQ